MLSYVFATIYVKLFCLLICLLLKCMLTWNVIHCCRKAIMLSYVFASTYDNFFCLLICLLPKMVINLKCHTLLQVSYNAVLWFTSIYVLLLCMIVIDFICHVFLLMTCIILLYPNYMCIWCVIWLCHYLCCFCLEYDSHCPDMTCIACLMSLPLCTWQSAYFILWPLPWYDMDFL